MHKNEISENIIDAVMPVHRIFVPESLESVYEGSLCHYFFCRTEGVVK